MEQSGRKRDAVMGQHVEIASDREPVRQGYFIVEVPERIGGDLFALVLDFAVRM